MFVFCFSFKENDSWSKGVPVTSTPIVVDVPKKSAAKVPLAPKKKQVTGKAVKAPAPVTQTAGRILTRRASKLQLDP